MTAGRAVAGVGASIVIACLGAAVEGQGTVPKTAHPRPRTVSREERADAIARAHVWRAPRVPIARASLGARPATPADLACRFTIGPVGGTTPKFRCTLDDGTELRVKYGGAPEIPAEAAATRLLSALGFGADEVALVQRLRCSGCPRNPFVTMKVVDATHTRAAYERVRDPDAVREFTWVAAERPYHGRAIEGPREEGWAFFELDSVDASKGGAPRAHVDALRLMAMFLAHWDNKADNQRLVCRTAQWPEGARCPDPFLLLQDVGATFGPRKMNLDAWEKAKLWDDRARCTISMKSMPHGGATFGSARVSERGRRFLVDLLGQLSDAQLTALFSSARFDKQRRGLGRPSPVSEWVRVFKQRVRALSDGPPCPAA